MDSYSTPRSVVDYLRQVHDQRLTATLAVTSDVGEVYFLFVHGRIATASTSVHSGAFIDILLTAGKITPAQAGALRERTRGRADRVIAARLVQQGFLTRAEVASLVRDHMQRCVDIAANLPDPDLDFQLVTLDPGFKVFVPVNIPRLIGDLYQAAPPPKSEEPAPVDPDDDFPDWLSASDDSDELLDFLRDFDTGAEAEEEEVDFEEAPAEPEPEPPPQPQDPRRPPRRSLDEREGRVTTPLSTRGRREKDEEPDDEPAPVITPEPEEPKAYYPGDDLPDHLKDAVVDASPNAAEPPPPPPAAQPPPRDFRDGMDWLDRQFDEYLADREDSGERHEYRPDQPGGMRGNLLGYDDDYLDTLRPPEKVRFTAFHPREAAADAWYTFLTYIHLPDLIDQVSDDAQKFADEMGGAPRAVRLRDSVGLLRGTELLIVPEAPGLTFKPRTLSLTWDEDIERANFRFKADADLIDQPAIGDVTIFAGPVEIGRIRFAIPIVDQPTGDAATDSVTADMHERVFISYSHQNTAIVKATIKVLQRLGMQVYADYITLRSGDDWDQRLLDMIEDSDIFQLFWSTQAAESPAVRREWMHALGLNKQPEGARPGVGYIRPVYWEDPLPGIPPELAHIHFMHIPELLVVAERLAT